ncbi:DMT family transporter [Pseudonocardia sp.]|uniref:DMT family transporter n=1 Tax=Pseudonocardia sp. TaxID=60912 RepID=UPI003D0CEAB7
MRAVGLIAALALLWGSGFFWIALALEGFTPTQLTFARLALGALVLVPLVLVRRLERPSGWRMWVHITVSAFVANALPYTLFAVAEQTVPSSVAGVVNATTPLWTLLVAFFVSGADAGLTGRRVLGVLLGFIGVVVVVEPWRGVLGGSTGGLVATVAAAASYGVAYVYQARYLTNRGISPLSLTAFQLVAAACLLLPTLPFGGSGPGPTTGSALALLILGVAGTGLALVINFTLIATEGPTAASVVTYLLPLVAVALGVTFLDEPARWTLVAGGLLILVGVGLARGRSRSWLAPNRRPTS